MLTAEEVKNLKALIKTEMQRRNASLGSMTSYAGAAYDFKVIPEKGGTILSEHGEKTLGLLNKIKMLSNIQFQEGEIIPKEFDSNLITYVNTLKTESMTGSSSCSSLCSGLCTTSCTTGCTSCSSCSGGCQGCSGCGGSCSYNCSGGCSGGCSGACSSACGSGCSVVSSVGCISIGAFN